MDGFIAVHLGAGVHSDRLLRCYKKLIRKACMKAVTLLKNGGTAVEACAEATVCLEDSPLTNAGYGSNLTWTGGVECDASVMDGKSLHYGAVGGVSGLKNPALLAKLLCLNQSYSLPCGRIPPSFLVGDGARMYALQNGLTTVAPSELISAESWKQYQRYKRRLTRHVTKQTQGTDNRLDTVGAVCIDTYGHVASCCSSGGIVLKSNGRVGQAAVYASGVWAQNAVGDNPAVASCTSGCGEHLVRTMLAREGALSVLQDNRTEISLHNCMKTRFLESPFLHEIDEKLGGILVLKYNPSQDIGEILWSHSTRTMCVGFMSTNDEKAKFRVSHLPAELQMGKSITMEGTVFHVKRMSHKQPATSDLPGSDCNDNEEETECLDLPKEVMAKEKKFEFCVPSKPVRVSAKRTKNENI